MKHDSDRIRMKTAADLFNKDNALSWSLTFTINEITFSVERSVV